MPEQIERIIGLEAKQRELCRRVGKIEGGEGPARERFDKVHARITKVEIRVAYYAGGAAAVGGLIGTLVGLGTLKIFGG